MADPLVIAHRGNSCETPENTLSAFRSALALGVDGVELDYHVCADGVPVVIHDDTLDRTTNATTRWRRKQVRLADCTLAELKELDYGAWFGKGQPFANEPLATLEEAIKLICGAGSLGVVERKAGDADVLVKLLERLKLQRQVVVMAFDWDFLRACHRLDASLALVALGDGPLTDKRLDELADTGAKTVNWDQRRLGSIEIAAIHQRGYQAWTWTVDDAARMQVLLDAGIDAITTNQPARALKVRSEWKLRSPAGGN